MRSKCINIHDPQSRVYELAKEYDGRRAVPKNFFMLLDSYQNHPEAKSLGPDGKPCEFDTRGLLQRAHIIANWPPIYIGKESDKHWEEGEDLSLLDFRTIEYKRKGNTIATDEQLAREAPEATPLCAFSTGFMQNPVSGHRLASFLATRLPCSLHKASIALRKCCICYLELFDGLHFAFPSIEPGFSHLSIFATEFAESFSGWRLRRWATVDRNNV